MISSYDLCNNTLWSTIFAVLGLRKKLVSPGSGAKQVDDNQPKTPGQMDLFGQADAIVKHVLEVCF